METDSASKTKSPEGDAIDWASESIEKLGGFCASTRGSGRSGRGGMTSSQRNAARLRDCVSPVELTQLISEVWRASPIPPRPFALDSGKGIVHDVEVSELLFFSESICKKLISFIGFHQTTKDAKAAAVDVFTWLCTQPAFLKSLFVGSDNICNWALSLAVDRDPEVSLAGLRGLVNLVKHETYRRMLHHNDKLVEILDQINLETEHGRQAATLAFMSLHAVISVEGCLKQHEKLVERLRTLALDPRLSSERELYWRLNCLLTAVILSKDRVNLMNSIHPTLHLHRTDESINNMLQEECINAYLLMVCSMDIENNPLEVDCELRENLVDKLVKRLGRFEAGTGAADSVLKLLAAIAKDNPTQMYDRFLNDNWTILEERLDKGTAAERALILDLFTALTSSPGPDEKRSLKQHEHGTRFVRLLLEDIDHQTMGILAFIWKHYEDAKEAFIEADVVPSLLSLYVEPNTQISDEVSVIVKKILCDLLGNHGTAAAEIQDQAIKGMKAIIDGRKVVQAERNLCLVGKILVEVTKINCSHRIMQWLVDEGLVAIYTTLSGLNQKTLDEDMLSDLSLIVERVMNSSCGCKSDRGFFLKKFVAVIKAIDCCASSKSHQITSHDWAREFYQTKHADNLSVSADICFKTAALTAISSLLKKNEEDRSGFLRFLLHIALEAGLRRAAPQYITVSGIANILNQMLNDWECEIATGDTSKAFVRCIGTVIGKEESVFQPRDPNQYHSSAAPAFTSFLSQSRGCTAKGMDNLWNLVIKNGQELCDDDVARENVLCFLRKHPRNGSNY